MKSKRGTYLIEAAVVLPMVILTVITVVLIVMFFYDCSVSQSNLHKELLHEAGSVSGKTVYYHDDTYDRNDAEVYFTYHRKRISAVTHVAMIHRGILRYRGQKEINGSIHLHDAAKYVLRRQKVEAFMERKQ